MYFSLSRSKDITVPSVTKSHTGFIPLLEHEEKAGSAKPVDRCEQRDEALLALEWHFKTRRTKNQSEND